MSKRAVKTENIATLKDWVARWPAANLRFDPDTREPTIYGADAVTKISSIPWKREADTITVLSQPTRFSAEAVEAATKRLYTMREQREGMRMAGEEQIRIAERAVLEAWHTYYAAPVAARSALRRDILAAESTLRQAEASLANKDRVTIKMGKDVGIYIPPMDFTRRGIPILL
jgi:hypothetical protein